MTRVYLPGTVALVATYFDAGEIGPAPLTGHAVTGALRSAWADVSEEECEYAALQEAAAASQVLQQDARGGRRVVLAVDVAEVHEDPHSTSVTLLEPVPWRLVAAVHADTDALPPDARNAEREELPDLAWFGTQEVGLLIGRD